MTAIVIRFPTGQILNLNAQAERKRRRAVMLLAAAALLVWAL